MEKLLPAKICVNPCTGKVQVYVTPQVAIKVKGNKSLRKSKKPDGLGTNE